MLGVTLVSIKTITC